MAFTMNLRLLLALVTLATAMMSLYFSVSVVVVPVRPPSDATEGLTIPIQVADSVMMAADGSGGGGGGVLEAASKRNLTAACFAHNSARWMEGPRHGNAQDSLMENDYGEKMILRLEHMLDDTPAVLHQTICLKDSRFLQVESPSTTLRIWSVRLIYLAVYYHQHQPALAEARLQSEDSSCLQSRTDHGLAAYDYECPDTKYLVISFWNNGIGANMEHVAIPTLMAGLALNRTVLFVSNAPEGPNWVIKMPWSLASCPRRDPQCFFAPVSPCVPSVADLSGAAKLNKLQKNQLFANATLPVEYENNRVVYMLALHKISSDHLGGKVKPTLQKIAHTLVDQLSEDDSRRRLLHQAADFILEEEGKREGYDYSGANSKLRHAMAFYAMRPNLSYQQRMKQILGDVLPADFDANNAVGLPIRASDKCKRESECLTFDQHMQVASKMWKRHGPSTAISNVDVDASIVFTTESTAMEEEQRLFVTNTSARSRYPAFRFVTNSHDVTPDSGRFRDVAKNVSADEAMLSAFSSLQLQLAARVSIGNCCSNFHRMLQDYLIEGCGAASDSYFHCLQEDDDPELRVCCFKSKSCIATRKRQIMERKTNSSLSQHSNT
jgi:hypothetical protein